MSTGSIIAASGLTIGSKDYVEDYMHRERGISLTEMCGLLHILEIDIEKIKKIFINFPNWQIDILNNFEFDDNFLLQIWESKLSETTNYGYDIKLLKTLLEKTKRGYFIGKYRDTAQTLLKNRYDKALSEIEIIIAERMSQIIPSADFILYG